MSAASRKSSPKISPDTPNATSSQASPAGPLPSNSPAGPQTGPSGPEAAPANRSAKPGDDAQTATNDTYGPLFTGLSKSADLQRSLANRLEANLAGLGSPLFRLTWKTWVMVSGAQICRLQALEHPIAVNVFGGWPTPTALDRSRGLYSEELMEDVRNGRARPNLGMDLNIAVQMTNCSSATVWDSHRVFTEEEIAAQLEGTERYIGTLGMNVAKTVKVKMDSWMTPKAFDGELGTPRTTGRPLAQATHLPTQVKLAAWGTPRVGNGGHGSPKRADEDRARLEDQVHAVAWTTPLERDWKDSLGMATEGVNPDGTLRVREDTLPRQVHGVIRIGSGVQEGNPENGGSLQLVPEFPSWLQGYPSMWISCAP